ncbi:MAG: ParB/RepB/Spo0J family partition protein, partial [Alphaproteobacteria bacterium]
QREDLGPVEEARGYQRLLDQFGHTQATVAGLVGKSRPHVANLLRLLSLPTAVLEMVQAGSLSAGHARALIGYKGAEPLAREIISRGLNVRQVESIVKGISSRSIRGEKSADIRLLEEDLTQQLGLSVQITSRGTGGELKIRFESNHQLDAVIEKLR